MKRKTKNLIGIGVLIIVVFGAGLVIRGSGKNGEPSAENNPGQESSPRIKVGVVPVQEGTISESVWVTGEVRPLQTADVISKISGRLERMRLADDTPIEEGIVLREGQVVAMIENDQYQAAVQTADATLAVAAAGRGLAEVNLAEARRERDRWVKLREGGSGSEQQLDQAVTNLERAQAELTAAEARIVQGQTALEQARVNLAESTIEAPLSGIVTRKYVDEGTFVGPATPLFRLSDISQVEITGGVADRYLQLLRIGQTRAEIEVDAFPSKSFSGRISRVRPELDPVTRTVAVTIRSPNEELFLKPGMYARIRLVLKEKTDVPLVPDEALISSRGEARVFVVEEGIASLRPIRLGLEEGNLREIEEGLQPGDLVVIRGQSMLRDGQAVEAEEVREQ